MTWEIKKHKKPLKKCVLIEGLPGIGNVGKLAADLLLQELKSEPAAEFFSYDLPNSVFVNEDNLVELPRIQAVHIKKKKDFIFLVGDVQPTDSRASYDFSETILDYAEENGCTEILTLGGIGLQAVPEHPTVYCTSNDAKLLKSLAGQGANPKIHGKVGPVMGISGLLLGLGKKRGIKAAALLAETLGHPMYVGLKGARATLEVLNSRYGFGVGTEDLDKEIVEMEKKLKQLPASSEGAEGIHDINYIG